MTIRLSEYYGMLKEAMAVIDTVFKMMILLVVGLKEFEPATAIAISFQSLYRIYFLFLDRNKK